MVLKSIDGKVPYIMVAGKDYVRGEMPLDTAQKICNRGTKQTDKRFPGYTVCVDGRYFFPAEKSTPKKKKKSDAS